MEDDLNDPAFLEFLLAQQQDPQYQQLLADNVQAPADWHKYDPANDPIMESKPIPRVDRTPKPTPSPLPSPPKLPSADAGFNNFLSRTYGPEAQQESGKTFNKSLGFEPLGPQPPPPAGMTGPRPVVNKETGGVANTYSTPGAAFAHSYDKLSQAGTVPMGPEEPPPPPSKPGEPSPVDLKKEPFVPPTPLRTDQSAAIRNRMNTNRFIPQWAEAMTTIGTHGHVSGKDIDFFREAARTADDPIKIQEYAAAADPNSPVSAEARRMLRVAYPDYAADLQNSGSFDKLSANDIRDYVGKIAQQGTNYDLMMRLAALKGDQASDLSKQNAGQTQELERLKAENARLLEEQKGKNAQTIQGQKNQGALDVQGAKNAGAAGRVTTKPLPPGIGKEVADIDTSIDLMNSISKDLDSQETGKLANFKNWIGQQVNKDDPKFTQFKQKVGTQLSQIVLNLTGKAATDSERKLIADNTPTVNDSNETFRAKLQNLYDFAISKRQNYIKSQSAAKYDMSGFREPSPFYAGGGVHKKSVVEGISDDAMQRERERRAKAKGQQ